MTIAGAVNVRAGVALIILLAGALGVALFALPDRVAPALGVEGQDDLAYRAGGAAFFGYAVASLFAIRAQDRARRILLTATIAAGLATAATAVLSIVGGHGVQGSAVILVGAVVATAAAAYDLTRAGAGDGAPPDIEDWLVAFLWWGIVATALFGLGGFLLGSTFGTLSGAAGTDDSIYRLAGSATIGILVGTALALRSRVWQEIHLVIVLAFVTNALTLVGALIVIARGHAFPGLWLILAAAVFNVVCLAAALLRHESYRPRILRRQA